MISYVISIYFIPLLTSPSPINQGRTEGMSPRLIRRSGGAFRPLTQTCRGSPCAGRRGLRPAAPGSGPARTAAPARLFGYGDNDQLLLQTGPPSLTDTFQNLGAGFGGVRYLEFRANDERTWVAVDNIVLGGVPEPSSWSLMIRGLGCAGAALRRRRALDSAPVVAD